MDFLPVPLKVQSVTAVNEANVWAAATLLGREYIDLHRVVRHGRWTHVDGVAVYTGSRGTFPEYLIAVQVFHGETATATDPERGPATFEILRPGQRGVYPYLGLGGEAADLGGYGARLVGGTGVSGQGALPRNTSSSEIFDRPGRVAGADEAPVAVVGANGEVDAVAG